MNNIARSLLICPIAAFLCLAIPLGLAHASEYDDQQQASDIGKVEDLPTSWRYQDGLALPESAIDTQGNAHESAPDPLTS